MRLVLLAVLLVSITHSYQSTTVPLFMWSPKSYFSSSTCTEGISEVLHEKDVSEGIQHLSEQTKSKDTTSLAKYFSSLSKKTQPEAIVAFIYPKLETAAAGKMSGAYAKDDAESEQQPLSFLKETLHDSKSCLFVPYVKPSASIYTAVTSIVEKMEDKTVPTVVDMKEMDDCSDLLEKITSKSKLFENGVTDLFMIKLESTSNVNGQCMKKVLDTVREHTTNFVSLLTADTGDTPVTLNFDNVIRKEMEVPETFNFAGVQSSAGSYAVEIDIDNVQQYSLIVVAVTISIFMILMLYIGLCCMMNIETPVRYPNKNLQIAREG